MIENSFYVVLRSNENQYRQYWKKRTCHKSETEVEASTFENSFDISSFYTDNDYCLKKRVKTTRETNTRTSATRKTKQAKHSDVESTTEYFRKKIPQKGRRNINYPKRKPLRYINNTTKGYSHSERTRDKPRIILCEV